MIRRWWRPIAALALALVAIAAVAVARARQPAPPPPRPAPIAGIGALGTLEPADRIRAIAAPGPSVRVGELLVGEGQDVAAGAVLARTDDHAVRAADLRAAEAQLAVAEAQLEQTRAGARPGELAAQRAASAAAEAALAQRQRDLARAEALARSDAAAAADVEASRLAAAAAAAALDEARARLAALAEVPAVDVALRLRQVEAARASVVAAAAALDRTVIAAPSPGRVLRIRARPGELVGGAGILDFGDVRTVHAVAEVYEADAARVRLGQPATVRLISSDTVCTGAHVVAIGPVVGRKVALDNDPVTDTDARVVEVRIALSAEDSRRLAGLINARVAIVIADPGP